MGEEEGQKIQRLPAGHRQVRGRALCQDHEEVGGDWVGVLHQP